MRAARRKGGSVMSRKCIGIDIGGTTVKLGMFEQDGTLLEKWEIPTRKENGGAHILEDIAAAIKKKAAERGLSTADFEGAGMGLPGPVLEDGHVEFCVNLGWKAMNPQKILSGLLDGMPVKSANDANVAALGELWQGGGRGYKNMVMITLGTGRRRDRPYPCDRRRDGAVQLRRIRMSGAGSFGHGDRPSGQETPGGRSGAALISAGSEKSVG